jgi:hypothetical protein
MPTVIVCDPAKLPGKLKRVGASSSGCLEHSARGSSHLVNLAGTQRLSVKSSWRDGRCVGRHLPKRRDRGNARCSMIACHHSGRWKAISSIECDRRAMISDQTFEGRRENLSQANKLSRTFATLVEALNRATESHGRARPRSQWRPSHCWQCRSARGEDKSIGGSTRAQAQVTDARQPSMWSAHEERQPVLIPRDGERPMQDARRPFAGRSKK